MLANRRTMVQRPVLAGCFIIVPAESLALVGRFALYYVDHLVY